MVTIILTHLGILTLAGLITLGLVFLEDKLEPHKNTSTTIVVFSLVVTWICLLFTYDSLTKPQYDYHLELNKDYSVTITDKQGFYYTLDSLEQLELYIDHNNK